MAALLFCFSILRLQAVNQKINPMFAKPSQSITVPSALPLSSGFGWFNRVFVWSSNFIVEIEGENINGWLPF